MTQDTVKKYPFLVGISYVDKMASPMICTGSLIEKNWVLTGAICVAKEREYFVTYTRVTGTQEKYLTVKVLGIVLHPEYTETRYANNIALVKIEDIEHITKYAQLSMSDYARRFRLPVLYARYWYDPVKKRTLHLAKFNITLCHTSPTNFEAFICVESPPDVKLYSGVQLIYNGTKVIGVYSGIARRFVPISDHYEWIRKEKEKESSRLSVTLTFDVSDDDG